ncbi:MAG: hypothetical protein ABFD13_06365 [Candidatus Cryosericum sp.]
MAYREDAKGGGSADGTPLFRELSDPPDCGRDRSIKQIIHQTGLLLCQKTVLLNTPDAGCVFANRLHQHKLNCTPVLEAHRNVALPIPLLLDLHIAHWDSKVIYQEVTSHLFRIKFSWPMSIIDLCLKSRHLR